MSYDFNCLILSFTVYVNFAVDVLCTGLNSCPFLQISAHDIHVLCFLIYYDKVSEAWTTRLQHVIIPLISHTVTDDTVIAEYNRLYGDFIIVYTLEPNNKHQVTGQPTCD